MPDVVVVEDQQPNELASLQGLAGASDPVGAEPRIVDASFVVDACSAATASSVPAPFGADNCTIRNGSFVIATSGQIEREARLRGHLYEKTARPWHRVNREVLEKQIPLPRLGEP
jgi:hypothetical protein